MAKTQGFVLADIGTANTFGNYVLGYMQKLGFIVLFQFMFQLVSFVEVIGDTALVAPGDKNHLGNTGFYCLLNRVLD